LFSVTNGVDLEMQKFMLVAHQLQDQVQALVRCRVTAMLNRPSGPLLLAPSMSAD